MTLQQFATLCYVTALFLVLRIVLGAIASLFLGRPMYKPGTNRMFGLSAIVLVGVGLLASFAA